MNDFSKVDEKKKKAKKNILMNRKTMGNYPGKKCEINNSQKKLRYVIRALFSLRLIIYT